ncbi:MAG: hypothetical protein QG585_109 [Patescibacteria group bacterium]|nr:hypothetical protein [Patescibacteria group bacterium]
MKKYSNEEYNKIFDSLPLEIRNVISSYDSVKKIIEIGKKHNLQIDQQGILNDLALDVMMGIVPSGKFIEELAKEINVTKLQASVIAHDVDEEILKPIKELMVKTYADGAPFRPKSSLQVTHEDENHEGIERDELLRSIEEPEISQVKKWRSDGTIESIVTFSDTKEFSKTPDPEVFKKTEPETPTNLSQTLKESRERLLNLISSKKLDSVVTMTPHEKTESAKPVPPTFASEEKAPIIQEIEKQIEVKKMPENPFIVTPPKVENVATPTIPTPPTPEFIVPKVEVALEVPSKSLPEIAPEILPTTTVPMAQKPTTSPVTPPVVSPATQTPVAKPVFNVVDPYREL